MSTADPAAEPKTLPRTSYSVERFGLLALVLVVGILASTLPQPQALGKLPLQNILKNQLHVKPSGMASFFLYCGLFWYIKPIAGILTDAFPIFGTRRRHYVLGSAVLAAAAWIGMGFVPHTFGWLLIGAIVVNLFMVMISTVAGAFLVEIGQSRGEVGKMTAVRQITYNACSLVQGPVGGMLATLALVFIALFYFAPGFSTLQYYRQNDLLHLSQTTIGLLGACGGLGGVIAAICYAFLARRVSLCGLIAFGVATCAAGTLLYVFYNSLALAWGIDFQNGLFFGFAEVALIDLAARATPAGCEGLGYSLILSIRNLSVFGADKLGAYCSDTYHVSWHTMVIVNAATTAVVLVILPFMPRAIMRSRDDQSPNAENTGEPVAG